MPHTQPIFCSLCRTTMASLLTPWLILLVLLPLGHTKPLPMPEQDITSWATHTFGPPLHTNSWLYNTNPQDEAGFNTAGAQAWLDLPAIQALDQAKLSSLWGAKTVQGVQQLLDALVSVLQPVLISTSQYISGWRVLGGSFSWLHHPPPKGGVVGRGWGGEGRVGQQGRRAAHSTMSAVFHQYFMCNCPNTAATWLDKPF